MIDWAAKWFEIRAEMGQSDMATFMYQDEGKGIVRAHFRHRETDGFGKMNSLLKAEGINVPLPSRPLKKPSPVFQPFLLLKGILRHPRAHHNPWKRFQANAPSAGLEDVSTWFLTTQENQILKSRAEKLQLNPGFYILSQTDQILRQELYANPEDTSYWLCPVDVRGAFPDAESHRNWVSFIVTKFTGPHTDQNSQKSFENYRNSLKSGMYWAFWELYQIGRWIGVSGMKRLARKAQNKSFWAGSFSDLGAWNQNALCQSKMSHRHWIIAPPGSASYPIGLTTIEWCGHRSITLKIHPAICNNNVELAEIVMSRFKEKTLGRPLNLSAVESTTVH